MQDRAFIRFCGFLIATAGSVFLSAGTLAWLRGWAFVAIISAAVGSVTFGVFRNNPDLLQERATAAKRAQGWDRILVPLVSGIPLIAVTVAGLGKRFAWNGPFPCWSAVIAAVVMVAGAAITYWSMRMNHFFSSHVRIQADRGHEVVRSGPYVFVRHPGYLGAVLVTLGTPVLLNSTPALMLALFTTALTVLRTTLEDRLLRKSLPGYEDYRRSVRYRLVPFVW